MTNNKILLVGHENLQETLSDFPLEGKLVGAVPYGSGHINDTYCTYMQLKNGNPLRYIVQRINTDIFEDPDALMQNIDAVTSFLRKDIIKNNGDPMRETLNVIKTNSNKLYSVDSNNGYWRVYPFVEDTIAYDTTGGDSEIFYNAATAFGKFIKRLDGYPAETLHETIPNFHNTRVRFADFTKAVKLDKINRANSVEKEIKFVTDKESITGNLVDLIKSGDIPLRVTHNDTKLNNVLFDKETGKGICVIDLDTVMPGSCLYDYGDSIRFGASSALEDEMDLSKVYLDLELFDAFTRGYLEETGDVLTKAEKDNLCTGALLMTYECGMRFLADHLSGDTYFRIHRENHNLDRARTQFKLVKDMQNKWDEMQNIVNRYI